MTFFPALVDPFPKIPPTNEEVTGAIIEAAIGASKGAKIHLLVFLFHILVFQ